MINLKKVIILLLLSSFGLASPLANTATHANAATQAKKDSETKLICKDKIKLLGFPNINKSIAHLRTVIRWSEQVTEKFNHEFGHWHNAKSKSVNCKKEGSKLYYTCTLTAIPCAYIQVKKETK